MSTEPANEEKKCLVKSVKDTPLTYPSFLYTFSNSKDNLFQGKTTCFGSGKGTKTDGCGTLFQGKTTCFGIMKAYEGKHFAFIRAIY